MHLWCFGVGIMKYYKGTVNGDGLPNIRVPGIDIIRYSINLYLKYSLQRTQINPTFIPVL
jgi:hypothetical protein